MIYYHSATGKIEGIPNLPNATGYSGHGAGLNNPNLERIKGIGPIPRGKWRIVRWEDHHGELGPQVAILEPDGWDAYDRSLFRIHGDNSLGNYSASNGCISASRAVRDAWRASGEMKFEVV
jgi:hypothetical protein